MAKVDGQAFEERMLFTHRGLSGPAILQLSSYWKALHPVCIEFLTTYDESIPKRLAQRLSSHEWTIEPAGTEGYTKAEVTLGGVATEELSSKTMESHQVPGLYFIGEVVDVTGHLGGHNFQWAWASAAAAAESIYKCKSQPEAPS